MLPPDYRDRLVALPPFGHLRVWLLSRRDVILMKVFGLRPRDVADLKAIAPRVEELASSVANSRGSGTFLAEWEAGS